jgi:hypothetical protein
MPDLDSTYDARYLAGVMLFNRRDFFEAHEVWESLWLSADAGGDRRFVQGLIQAAVGLYHFSTNNPRGARKLFHTARAYMEVYPERHLGLHRGEFWNAMERCFAPVLAGDEPPAGAAPDESLMPTIEIDPAPDVWPDPSRFLDEEH